MCQHFTLTLDPTEFITGFNAAYRQMQSLRKSMPNAPPTVCSTPSCGGRRINGVCDRGCNRTKNGTARSGKHELTTTQRGYGWDWQQFQPRFLAEHPICEDCLEAGIVTAASEVHHVMKIKDRPDLKLDPDNCRALCKPCHLKRSAKGE